jgi:hypothetical protein
MKKVLQQCGFTSVEEVQTAAKKYSANLSALELLEGLNKIPKRRSIRSRAERDDEFSSGRISSIDDYEHHLHNDLNGFSLAPFLYH